jgi:glycosyltransferase involved in cell wall biosynthesis
MLSVSVVICTWNRAASLRRTLESLRGIDRPASRVEVIVVDNNSKDDTRRVVDTWAAEATGWDVRYVFEPRQGKQFALNTGLAAASGDLFVFTDDDVTFERSWLVRIADAFAEKGVDLLGGITVPEFGRPRPVWYHPTMSAVVAEVNAGSQRLDDPPSDYAPSGTTLAVRRTVIDTVGGFSEQHFRHMDYEFGMRVRRAGFRARYDPAIVVHTAVPDLVFTKRYFRRWYFKQGIARSLEPVNGATLLAVPRWMWRQIGEEGVAASRAFVRRRRAEAFAHQLRIAHLMGYIASRWSRLWRPSSHLRWTERWSQKSGEVFR